MTADCELSDVKSCVSMDLRRPLPLQTISLFNSPL
jgi:hypothetical protein